MIHELVTKLIHLGWLLLPIPLYALYNKHYLDENQAHLLIVQGVLLFSLMLPGWLMYAIKLVVTGYFVLVVLDLCIVEFEEFLSRYEVGDKTARFKMFREINGTKLFMVDYYRTMKKFKLKQTFIWPLFVLIWILIRIRFTRVVEYGKGQILQDGSIFEGFLITLDGWNCNYTEHTTVTFIWLIILVFCNWFLVKILQCAKTDKELTEQYHNDMNGYKIYLLSYLIQPAIVVLGIDFVFNLVAHCWSWGLLDCYQYFKQGFIVFVVMQWGVAGSIGLFFYKKIGRFSLQSEHGNSQVSQDDQQMQMPQNQRLLQTPKN